MSKIKSIIIKDYGHVFLEGKITGSYYPGMTGGIDANGGFQETFNEGQLGGVLTENELEGKGVNDALVTGDHATLWIPQRGDELWARADTGQYNVGDVVSLTNDGEKVQKVATADASYVLAQVVETKNVPASPTGDQDLIHIRMI